MSENQAPVARQRKRHEMKAWPEFFKPTLNATKRFELRRDDRDGGFQVGDELLIREWDPQGEFGSPADNTEPVGYTGKQGLLRVDYVLSPAALEKLGVPLEGYAILSVSLIP